MILKTRNAVFISVGSMTLASILLSKYNRKWLWLGGLMSAALIHAGTSGFCGFAYLFEKTKLTRPDYGHFEEEKLKDKHKLKIIKKIRKVRREITGYLKEAEANQN